MAIKGVFASDANIQGTKKGDFASSILQVDPTGRAQLLALSAGMPEKSMKDIVTIWFEETHISGNQKVSTGGNSAATSIIVADASSYTVGVILEVQDTLEQVLVTGISGNTLTIERAFGGSTAQTIGASTTYVQRISNANEEGSSRPVAVANIGVPKNNYAQIFRNSWDVTGTAQAVEYITGSVGAKNQRDAGLFHAEDMERAFWWGRKALGIRNGKPFRTCDGILNQISTNDTDAGALTNWAEVDTFIRSVFERNVKGKPNERIAYCGNTTLSVLNRLAALNSQITITPGQAEFGLKVMKWLTPYGDISLMTHPLMVENAVWTRDLHVLHPGAIEVRYLRKTHHDAYNSDGSRGGVDADYGVFTTEASICYMAEITGGSMTGFTAASNT